MQYIHPEDYYAEHPEEEDEFIEWLAEVYDSPVDYPDDYEWEGTVYANS